MFDSPHTFIENSNGVWSIPFSGDTVLPIFGMDMCRKQYINLVQAALIGLVMIFAQVFIRKKLPNL